MVVGKRHRYEHRVKEVAESGSQYEVGKDSDTSSMRGAMCCTRLAATGTERLVRTPVLANMEWAWMPHSQCHLLDPKLEVTRSSKMVSYCITVWHHKPED
jgi:hypothetical protein